MGPLNVLPFLGGATSDSCSSTATIGRPVVLVFAYGVSAVLVYLSMLRLVDGQTVNLVRGPVGGVSGVSGQDYGNARDNPSAPIHIGV